MRPKMKKLAIIMALVALPTYAESVSEQRKDCQQTMYKEFPYPGWRVFDDTLVGCMNPAICGSVWSSFSFNVRRNPAGDRMYVWCRWKEGETTLSEKNPDGKPKDRFALPPS